MAIQPKIKVIVIDDSALIRSLLSEIINRQHDMVCVGVAPDPFVAREMIKHLNPDVLTLDIEMPKMDGLEFLSRLMRLRPIPVVMISSLTAAGADVTLKALELGAIDYVAKPKIGIAQGMAEYAEDIAYKLRAAYQSRHAARFTSGTSASVVQHNVSTGASPVLPTLLGQRFVSTEKIIAIGASTGGTEAIREVLIQLPPDMPAIVITQHMPPGFTRSFADRLNTLCKLTVREAVDGERILPGHVYIAPGDQHLCVVRNGANYQTKLDNGAAVNRHKPSVEVLFQSVADNVGASAIGIMLTGMGKDGATGMLRMRECGAHNLAQDEQSCVVFGMPREAVAVGATHEVLPLNKIAPRLMELSMKAGISNRV
jgi:two-component system chemotaxis response regulator CheB